jgi:hypothetical protein
MNQTNQTLRDLDRLAPPPTYPMIRRVNAIPVPAAESGLAAPDHRVLLTGGQTGAAAAVASASASEFVQDVPATGPFSIRPDWAASSSMASPRRAAGSVAYNGKVYVAGGFDDAGTALNSIEEYDPASDTWATLSTTLAAARGGAGTALVGNLMYVFGGDTGLGSKTNVLEIVDLQNLTRVSGTAMSTARSHFAHAAFGGYLYAFGGDGGGGTVLASVERYNPGTDSWAPMAPLPSGCMGALCLEEGGRLRVFGGEIPWPPAAPTGTRMTDRILLYDDVADAYTIEDRVLPYPARDLFGCARSWSWTHRGMGETDEFTLLGGGHDGTNHRDGFFRFYTR